jgi:hypothetical protein
MCQPNVDELSSLFEIICIRFGTWKVRRLKLGLRSLKTSLSCLWLDDLGFKSLYQ